MLILQERKSVNTIRGTIKGGTRDFIEYENQKPVTVLLRRKPNKEILREGKVSSWLLFEKNLAVEPLLLPNRPLFWTKCFMK